jgi:hypothetical protein
MFRDPAQVQRESTPHRGREVLRRQASRIGASPAAGPDSFTRIGFLCLGPTGICAGHRLAPYWRGGFAGSRFGPSVLQPSHMRTPMTSALKKGASHLRQTLHPTDLTTAGGCRS